MFVLWLDWPTTARIHLARRGSTWASVCTTISAEWVHDPQPARLLTTGFGSRPFPGSLVHLGWIGDAPTNRRVCSRCLSRYMADDRQLFDFLEAIGQSIG